MEPFQIESGAMEPLHNDGPRDITREKNLSWIQKNFQGAFAAIFVTGLVIGVVVGLFVIGGGSRHKGESNKVVLVAHRGAMEQAPENTLEAIHLAFNQHADAVQFELQVSSDKQLFLGSNDLLTRRATKECPKQLCGNDHKSPTNYDTAGYETMLGKQLQELSYNDFIKYLNVAADPDRQGPLASLPEGKMFDPEKTGVNRITEAHPPLLKEVMIEVLARSKIAYCELKPKEDPSVLKLIADLATQNKYNPGSLWFTSFDIGVLKEMKKLLPTFKVMLKACTRALASFSRDGEEEYCGGKKGTDSEGREFARDDALDILEDAKEGEVDGLAMDAWLGHSVTQRLGEEIVKLKESQKKPQYLLAWAWRGVIPEERGGDTVDNIKALQLLGIDAFETNFPKGVRDWASHDQSCNHAH